MTIRERHQLFEQVDNIITLKLEALRSHIWAETKGIAEDDLEDFISELRISAVFL